MAEILKEGFNIGEFEIKKEIVSIKEEIYSIKGEILPSPYFRGTT